MYAYVWGVCLQAWPLVQSCHFDKIDNNANAYSVLYTMHNAKSKYSNRAVTKKDLTQGPLYLTLKTLACELSVF